jgi:hypothetical protein
MKPILSLTLIITLKSIGDLLVHCLFAVGNWEIRTIPDGRIPQAG